MTSGAAPQVAARITACRVTRLIERAEAPVSRVFCFRLQDKMLAEASNAISVPQAIRNTVGPVSQKTPAIMAAFKILIVMVSGTS